MVKPELFQCPQPQVTKPPGFVPPKGSIDAHCHIYARPADYPMDPGIWYRPPRVDVPDYLRMLEILGVERAVFVQAQVYSDHALVLDVMAAHPGRFKAVAHLKESVTDAELAKLNAGGVRGFRTNLVSGNGIGLDVARRMADRVAKFGWHAQFLINAETMPEMDKTLGEFPIEVVVDHMGRPDIDAGTGAPGFQALLRLLRGGRAWCKLSAPYRTSKIQPGFQDIDVFAQALVETAPDRLVWGGDWPHVNMEEGKPMPNDGDLFDKMMTWAPTEELRRKILVTNPEKLYGFDPV